MWLREMAGGVLPQPEAVEDLHSSSIRLTDGDLVEVFAPPYPGPGRRSMGKLDQLNVSNKMLTSRLNSCRKDCRAMADRGRHPVRDARGTAGAFDVWERP